ncbi:MAG: hypothetical protein ACRD52_04830 [Candidatus Acidiferrales bacterium]
MGRAFIAAGSALSGTPERLIFDKEAYDGRFGGAEAIRVSDLDEKYALSLTNELRSKIIRLEEITAQLSGMGIKV